MYNYAKYFLQKIFLPIEIDIKENNKKKLGVKIPEVQKILAFDTDELSLKEKKEIDINSILNNLTEEMKKPITQLGEAIYNITAVLTKYLNNFENNDGSKEIIYKHVSELTGFSTKTLKNLVWLNRKLSNFETWESQSNIFKLKMFILGNYIVRVTSESSKVLEEVYKEACEMKEWFENSKISEIKSWFKTVFHDYIKTFPYHIQIYCVICERELKEEKRGEVWDFYPICNVCWTSVVNESWVKDNKELLLDKIGIVRNKIAKIYKEELIQQLRKENEELREKCLGLLNLIQKLKSKKFASKLLKEGKLEVGANA